MIIYNKRVPHDSPVAKYSVGGGAVSHFAHASTLAEAKAAGASIAKKEAWRGKWNLLYLTLTIQKQDAPGSMFYKRTGWEMFVPVRGTGRRAEDILDTIRRREKAAPMKWVKR